MTGNSGSSLKGVIQDFIINRGSEMKWKHSNDNLAIIYMPSVIHFLANNSYQFAEELEILSLKTLRILSRNFYLKWLLVHQLSEQYHLSAQKWLVFDMSKYCTKNLRPRYPGTRSFPSTQLIGVNNDPKFNPLQGIGQILSHPICSQKCHIKKFIFNTWNPSVHKKFHFRA